MALPGEVGKEWTNVIAGEPADDSDDRLHSPNEKMDWDQFHRGIEASARFMQEVRDI